ncbi:hypothetical protein DFJ74DRAFT_685504 [Hyaloraphidium curvatum]|nr:hypothetical protein DFJ74DRAFT_685504 [Hyaloraphidium curvatum]
MAGRDAAASARDGEVPGWKEWVGAISFGGRAGGGNYTGYWRDCTAMNGSTMAREVDLQTGAGPARGSAAAGEKRGPRPAQGPPSSSGNPGCSATRCRHLLPWPSPKRPSSDRRLLRQPSPFGPQDIPHPPAPRANHHRRWPPASPSSCSRCSRCLRCSPAPPPPPPRAKSRSSSGPRAPSASRANAVGPPSFPAHGGHPLSGHPLTRYPEPEQAWPRSTGWSVASTRTGWRWRGGPFEGSRRGAKGVCSATGCGRRQPTVPCIYFGRSCRTCGGMTYVRLRVTTSLTRSEKGVLCLVATGDA